MRPHHHLSSPFVFLLGLADVVTDEVLSRPSAQVLLTLFDFLPLLVGCQL